MTCHFASSASQYDVGSSLLLCTVSKSGVFTGCIFCIVSWDPRGIGATLPAVNCFNSSSEETAFWQNTAPQPEPSE